MSVLRTTAQNSYILIIMQVIECKTRFGILTGKGYLYYIVKILDSLNFPLHYNEIMISFL